MINCYNLITWHYIWLFLGKCGFKKGLGNSPLRPDPFYFAQIILGVLLQLEAF